MDDVVLRADIRDASVLVGPKLSSSASLDASEPRLAKTCCVLQVADRHAGCAATVPQSKLQESGTTLDTAAAPEAAAYMESSCEARDVEAQDHRACAGELGPA